MIRLEDYIDAMKDGVAGIADAIYEGDRPTSVSNKTDSFIVVDIPAYINNKELDESGTFDYYTTTVSLFLFVRDRISPQAVGIWNKKKLSELTQELLGKFPIVDKERSVKVTHPRVIFSASDGKNFHYTTIQARLTTYF